MGEAEKPKRKGFIADKKKKLIKSMKKEHAKIVSDLVSEIIELKKIADNQSKAIKEISKERTIYRRKYERLAKKDYQLPITKDIE